MASEWVREPHPGVPRPLCRCWKCDNGGSGGGGGSEPGSSSGGGSGSRGDGSSSTAGSLAPPAATPSVTPSDLRLLRRPRPPITELCLSDSPCVTDEWAEVLASHHAASLRALDLRGCTSLSANSRPLHALAKLTALEHLRLPAEKWHVGGHVPGTFHVGRRALSADGGGRFSAGLSSSSPPASPACPGCVASTPPRSATSRRSMQRCERSSRSWVTLPCSR